MDGRVESPPPRRGDGGAGQEGRASHQRGRDRDLPGSPAGPASPRDGRAPRRDDGRRRGAGEREGQEPRASGPPRPGRRHRRPGRRQRGGAVMALRIFNTLTRPKEEGVAATVVSERYIDEYRTDMASIGVQPADVEPKATEHIAQMVALVERLIGRGAAYVVEGDVYFEVRRFPEYGKLSGKNLDELEAGARVDVDERKRDPLDFALWKASKPGEPSWPSPWGTGRPGWHIECSAMAMQYLGESFDFHGGGEDLIFPHHENEIAQSEGATGKPFA